MILPTVTVYQQNTHELIQYPAIAYSYIPSVIGEDKLWTDEERLI